MISITFTDNAAALLKDLQELPPKMTAVICAALDYQNELTIGDIQANQLSARGPETLGVVTGRLRQSIRRTNATITADGITSSIGTNVVYAGPHEFGFDGPESVRGYTRRVKSRDVRGKVDGKRRQIAQGVAFVRAHVRQMHMPERSFIRRTIELNAPNYTARVSNAVVTAWEGK